MTFLQKVCFKRESLTITYDNFCQKSLVIPKSKSPNWQGFQSISYKAHFPQTENMHLIDTQQNINYTSQHNSIYVYVNTT